MATIREFQGNLFDTSCQTVVNTVNCVGVMGKGIALHFRFRYPQMFESYVRCCDKGELRPGRLQLWTKSHPWILNFPTKLHWKHPSKLEYIEEGLAKFADTYQQRKITSIAFPQLGTSCGGLAWDDVRKLMVDALEPLPNLEVEIYQYNPAAADAFFDRMYQRIHRFDVDEYKTHLGVPRKQAQILRDALAESRVHSMEQLVKLNGVGDKTIEKLCAFGDAVQQGDQQRIVTNNERQYSLVEEPTV